jgi:hypothetical protein
MEGGNHRALRSNALESSSSAAPSAGDSDSGARHRRGAVKVLGLHGSDAAPLKQSNAGGSEIEAVQGNSGTADIDGMCYAPACQEHFVAGADVAAVNCSGTRLCHLARRR